MFGSFKRLFEKKTTKKSRQEFFRILDLENKRLKIQAEYGEDLPEEIAVTQKEMLRNNVLTLARVVDSEGGFENSLKKMYAGYYFNIQGTKPQVHIYSLEENEAHSDPFSHKTFYETKGNEETSIKCDRIDTGVFAGIIEDMIKLEEKFMNLRSSKIKDSVKSKIIYLAEQKIVKKVQEFADMFKGNEQLIKEYVFSGLTGEDDHWHNYHEFKMRLHFIGLLYYKLVHYKKTQDEWDKGLNEYPDADSEDFEIGVKNLIFIHSERNLKIKEFLELLNVKRHDFIVHERKPLKGGSIIDY